MKAEQSINEVKRVVLKPFQSSRAKGTNPRKKKTNPRAKGTNTRVNTFLANVLEIVRIKEGRPLSAIEIDQLTMATIEFFTSQYFKKSDHAQ
jgi:hypothetical protein